MLIFPVPFLFDRLTRGFASRIFFASDVEIFVLKLYMEKQIGIVKPLKKQGEDKA